MPLTDTDIQRIAKLLQSEVPPLVEKATESYFHALKSDLDNLTTSVDEFLRIVRRHEEEWLVLRAQHAKIRDLLVKKGIATESELAIS